MEQEIALTGGRTTTGVVRIGSTFIVRSVHERRSSTNSCVTWGRANLMALRDFLEWIVWVERFFPSCPDMCLLNSETSQIHNWSPLRACCVKLHDATLDCPLRNTHEIVCHGDASPCNCVFVDGMPTAFIDFDNAHAGSRLDDLGYAAWLWIDIGNDDLSVDRQGQRVADFFRAYGLETDGAIPSIIAAQLALAARTDSANVRAWSDSCRQWVECNRDKLSTAIAARANNAMQPTSL